MSSGNTPLLDAIKHSRLSHLGIAITFFVTGLIINTIQLVLYVTLRRFNKVLYRKINWYLNYAICSRFVQRLLKASKGCFLKKGLLKAFKGFFNQ
uniref:Uncharacterized protein n=1 Tax=Megaselia scalaris TaxID=36166 RepID=T1GLZ8_MEGSC